ncbi:MAG: polysaccharide biosynthesis/export family protein [Flavobacteriaceae bacterium]
MRMKFMCWMLLALAALALPSCASNRHVAGFTASGEQPYLLDSGDRIRIIVFGQEELTNSFAVDGAGVVSLPLIGDVPARGRTTGQLEQSIAAKLRQGFLRDPHVTAEVEIYRPFFTLGEVAAPGRYAYVNGMTARNAVSIAGGFTPRAVKNRVKIVRQFNGEEIEAVVPIDTPVRPGDTVQVIERWF